jgi:predicted DNA-binding protein (UPF0251 family)
MHLRSRRTRGEPADLPEDPVAGSTFRPSGFAVAREEQVTLLRALTTLHTDLQIALELFDWEDMGTADIATVLDIPRGTVKTRRTRARTRLKEAVEAEASSLALATSTAGDIDRLGAIDPRQLQPLTQPKEIGRPATSRRRCARSPNLRPASDGHPPTDAAHQSVHCFSNAPASSRPKVVRTREPLAGRFSSAGMSITTSMPLPQVGTRNPS